MESDTNVATISGIVVTDLEYRVIPTSKTPVAIFRIASNHRSFTEEGKLVRRRMYLTVKAYGSLADSSREALRRSIRLTIVGKLVEESWPSPNEEKKKSHLILEAISIQLHAVFPASIGVNERISSQKNQNVDTNNDASAARKGRTERLPGYRVKPIPPPAGYN